ncbi:hypothetical protein [Rhodoferax sp.]|uniref:hypothetical protein n=1 Tax=Rhodoferax sp. TaxID=50421 RepID=UPI00374D50DD
MGASSTRQAARLPGAPDEAASRAGFSRPGWASSSKTFAMHRVVQRAKLGLNQHPRMAHTVLTNPRIH